MLKKGVCFCFLSVLYVVPAYATFIESTIGTAVINDATATYFNPASLSLIKTPQFIALGAVGSLNTEFEGSAVQILTNQIQSGTSNTISHYVLPSLYIATPSKYNLTIGFAAVANDFNRDIDGFSILRYAQAGNKINDIDLIPGFSYKINEKIAVGANLNRSYARFILEPIIGIPGLNIPDSKSLNDAHAASWGWDVGMLFKPFTGTLIGFNYRSAVSYFMKGTSTITGPIAIRSNSYGFDYWTPARSVVSITQFITPKINLVGTVQYIQWGIFKRVTVHDIATPTGIVHLGTVPYYFHNSWLITGGTNYRFSSKLVIRGAVSYTQSPSTGTYQIDTGDSLTVGGSIGYKLSKHFIFDASYAHAFIQAQDDSIITTLSRISGTNSGALDAVALKLTVL